MYDDPRIEDSVRHIKAVTGREPPTSPEEAASSNGGEPSEHPVESIMEDADMGVVRFLDGDVSGEEPVTDGGYEQEVYGSDGGEQEYVQDSRHTPPAWTGMDNPEL